MNFHFPKNHHSFKASSLQGHEGTPQEFSTTPHHNGSQPTRARIEEPVSTRILESPFGRLLSTMGRIPREPLSKDEPAVLYVRQLLDLCPLRPTRASLPLPEALVHQLKASQDIVISVASEDDGNASGSSFDYALLTPVMLDVVTDEDWKYVQQPLAAGQRHPLHGAHVGKGGNGRFHGRGGSRQGLSTSRTHRGLGAGRYDSEDELADDMWADPTDDAVGKFDASGRFIVEAATTLGRPTDASGRTLAPEDCLPSYPSWYYRDPSGKLQGPFDNSQMTEWHKGGYFSMALALKPATDANVDFKSLREWKDHYGGVLPWSPEAANVAKPRTVAAPILEASGSPASTTTMMAGTLLGLSTSPITDAAIVDAKVATMQPVSVEGSIGAAAGPVLKSTSMDKAILASVTSHQQTDGRQKETEAEMKKEMKKEAEVKKEKEGHGGVALKKRGDKEVEESTRQPKTSWNPVTTPSGASVAAISEALKDAQVSETSVATSKATTTTGIPVPGSVLSSKTATTWSAIAASPKTAVGMGRAAVAVGASVPPASVTRSSGVAAAAQASAGPMVREQGGGSQTREAVPLSLEAWATAELTRLKVQGVDMASLISLLTDLESKADMLDIMAQFSEDKQQLLRFCEEFIDRRRSGVVKKAVLADKSLPTSSSSSSSSSTSNVHSKVTKPKASGVQGMAKTFVHDADDGFQTVLGKPKKAKDASPALPVKRVVGLN